MISAPDFTRQSSRSDDFGFYDLELDEVLIEQSIAKQYGVLPSEQGSLKYSDWAKMVSGLMDDTPLGVIVQIRAETDPEVLKNFSPEQRKIRAEWQSFRANKLRENPENLRAQMAALERTFALAFGKGADK